jgi:transposase
MRQSYRGGEKLFVDYAGLKAEVVDRETGEVTEHPVFVATLGASSYTYAEAQESEEMRSWVAGHIRAFEYFGGVAEITVPDNLKTGVTKPSYYEPDINPTYQELATHYDTVVIPARVRKPRDKAKVENAVQQVERWLMAPLRKQVFFSLDELNDALGERLEWLNNRPLSKLDGTRRTLYEELDLPALKPLPAHRFEVSTWKPNVGVNIDYHVEFERHYYSVPHQLVGQRVDVRATTTTIECWHRSRRVASHLRSFKRGGFTTDPSHRPKSHQRTKWPPSRVVSWAARIGPQTEALVREVIKNRPHPEQGYRSSMGILRLSKRYGEDRLELACRRALALHAYSSRSVESMLKTGMEAQPLPGQEPDPPSLPLLHENVRGPDYYH